MQPWFVDYATRIADGDPFYLACPDCEATSLPPRAVCPNCGTLSLEERPLDPNATVVAATTINSTIPAYADETPYEVVIAAFEEGVKLTGQVRDGSDVEPGEGVRLGATERGEDQWLLTFSPT